MTAGGSLVAFDIAGDKAGCFRFLNALRLVDISNNLGDSKSLITHPATTTHSRLKPEERAELGISDCWCGFRRGWRVRPILSPISIKRSIGYENDEFPGPALTPGQGGASA